MRRFVAWLKDLERFGSFELRRIAACVLSNWSVLIMAPFSGSFWLLLLLGRVGIIEILAAGGDESNKEKRLNILSQKFLSNVAW